MRKIKWMRKMVSALLVAGLLLTLLPTGVWASDVEEGAAPTTNGNWTDENNYDVSWYTETLKKDPNAKEFTLSDEKDLAGLAAITNGLLENEKGATIQEKFAGRTITISSTTALNLSAHEWVPIEDFRGTFDGNDVTISGLTIDGASENQSVGLFGSLTGTVKNVKLASINIKATASDTKAGGVVGYNCGGTVKCCQVTSGSITFAPTKAANGYIGGIVGRNDSPGTIQNCTNESTVQSIGSSTANEVGGIVGKFYNGTLTNCQNTGAVSNNGGCVGGIAGRSYYSGLSSCTNKGEVSGDINIQALAGIVGSVGSSASENYSISNCHNTGKITAKNTLDSASVGGVVGALSDKDVKATITQCSNSADITGSAKNTVRVGGIVALSGVSSLEMTQCYNSGGVELGETIRTSHAGGLISYVDSTTSTVTISNCYNVGKVSSVTTVSSVAGGFIGYNRSTTTTLSNSYQAGSVTGEKTGYLISDQAISATVTATDVSYLVSDYTDELGTPKTANEMTDDTNWASNLGLDSSCIWSKTQNPVDDESVGYLPILTKNSQDDPPTLERTSDKKFQAPLTITNTPTNNQVHQNAEPFTLGYTGGSGEGAVTWSITKGVDMASVDPNTGTVTLKPDASGEVEVTVTKAGDADYLPAQATYQFDIVTDAIDSVTVYGLKVPVVNEKPVSGSDVKVPDDAHYWVMTAAGVGGDGGEVFWIPTPTGTFASDQQYTVQFRLNADKNYHFADPTNISFDFDGINMKFVESVKSEFIDNDNLLITIVFKTTTHAHNFDTSQWGGYDATHHWHACTNDDCPLFPSGMPDYAPHTDSNNDGICDTCRQTIGYTISFDANGGACDTATARTTLAGTLSTLPTTTREGYTFRGWFTTANGGTQVTTETVFDTDTTIYAQWEKIPDPPYSGKYNYPVTVTDTDNGSVLLDKADEWVTGGETVTFSIAPDEAYLLESLTITDKNGKEITVKDNGDGTYTFTMPESAVTITATFAEDPDWEPTPEPGDAWPFVDVSAGDWFYDPVAWAYEQGLMTGTSATTFEPNISTTRGMIVAILHRLEDSPVVNYAMTFDDVADGDWYAEAVRWAASEGIVAGYSDAQFGPNDPITREQMAAILYNYAEWKGYDVSARADLSGYSDQPSAWAVEVMQWAKAEGLINGTTATTLDPQGHATRAQVAAILQRFLEN